MITVAERQPEQHRLPVVLNAGRVGVDGRWVVEDPEERVEIYIWRLSEYEMIAGRDADGIVRGGRVGGGKVIWRSVGGRPDGGSLDRVAETFCGTGSIRGGICDSGSAGPCT